MVTSRAILVLPLLACGCVATAVYGSARPLAPGAVQAAILVEQVAHGDAILAPDRSGDTFLAAVPGPGVEARFGLARPVDLGLRLSTASGFASDLKIGVVQRGRVAIALDPAIQVAPYVYGGDVAGQASLRVLASFRASESFELVGHGTFGAMLDRSSEPRQVVGTWGGGLGPLFQVAPTVALQPSLTMLWRADRARWHPELAMGLGILLGRDTP